MHTSRCEIDQIGQPPAVLTTSTFRSRWPNLCCCRISRRHSPTFLMYCDPSPQPPSPPEGHRDITPLTSSPVGNQLEEKDRALTTPTKKLAAAPSQPCPVCGDISAVKYQCAINVSLRGRNLCATDQPLIATRSNAQNMTVRCKGKHAEPRHVHVIGAACTNA